MPIEEMEGDNEKLKTQSKNWSNATNLMKSFKIYELIEKKCINLNVF